MLGSLVTSFHPLRNRTILIALILSSLLFFLTISWRLSSERLALPRVQAALVAFVPKNAERVLLGEQHSLSTFANAVKEPSPLAANAFAHFRQNGTCTVDSRDIRAPVQREKCTSLPKFLESMTNGERAFQDSPFLPMDCDMTWYTTNEICEILGRFAKVWLVGDSLMRHIASALHILLREDFIEGAFAAWYANEEEQKYLLLKQMAESKGEIPPEPSLFDCRCDRPFSNGGCLFFEAFSSADVWKHEPQSMKCDRKVVSGVEFVIANSYPIDNGSLDRLLEDVAEPILDASGMPTAPARPHAVVFGNGLWYDLNVTMFEQWTVDMQEQVIKASEQGHRHAGRPRVPMLAVTPSAGGPLKPHKYVDAQNNVRIKAFEEQYARWLAGRRVTGGYGSNIDHLGTYNATILNSSPDGTHAGIRADLLKAMMVLNWLDWTSR